MKENLINIKHLTVDLKENNKRILNDISLNVSVSSMIGIAGGSGSGKTTLGLMMLRLMPAQMRKVSGEIYFENKELFSLKQSEISCIRGKRIAMVFQEPLSAFNPLYTIGQHMTETLICHRVASGMQAKMKALMWLKKCGIEEAERVFLSYPHELSGGLRQRAMIAQAVCCEPSLLIADEPTSNLDVQTQQVVLELFKMLRIDLGIAIVMISHDLHALRRVVDEVVVMHQGSIVERMPATLIKQQAEHPYTQALLKAELM